MQKIPQSMQALLKKIHINIPFTMLHDTYLDRFLENRINPEIGIDAQALERFSTSTFKRIAKMLQNRSLSITLHGPFIDMSPGSTDPAVIALTRTRFKQLIEIVPLFSPKAVVCHAGYDWKRYGYFKDEWLENSLKTWTWLANSLNECGTRLMLENVYEYGPEEIYNVIDGLKSQSVGFCLDCGHLAAFGKTPLNLWLKSLGPHIKQLHLHDNHGFSDEHLAMGLGTIDFDLLFNYLKKIGNQPSVITLEPHHEEDLWPSLEYLAKVWPW